MGVFNVDHAGSVLIYLKTTEYEILEEICVRSVLLDHTFTSAVLFVDHFPLYISKGECS